MSTKYIASNWRLPNEENSNKNDNYGLSFDGNELIDLGSDSTLEITSDFSISVWIKDSSSLNRGIFCCGDRNNGAGWHVYRNSSNKVAFNLYAGNSKTATSTTSINTGEWFHIVATFEKNGTANEQIKIYINTVKEGQNGWISSQTPSYSGTIYKQIAYPYAGVNEFIGSISECTVFDYALSSTQISTLYGSSSLGAGNPMALKPQPVAYYPLGDNSASNPLTQPNEAVEDASVFDFDGSSVINSNLSLDNSNGITLSLWMKAGTQSGLVFLCSNGGTGGANSQFNFRFGQDGKLYQYLNGGFTGVALIEGLNNNEWNNIVITLNYSTGDIIGYKNTTQGPNTLTTGSSYTTVEIDCVGAATSSGTYGVVGEISNVQVWQTVLNTSEIETLYNSGVPLTGTQPQASNLKAWYKLDQSANWEADTSGAWQIPDAVSSYPQSFDFVSADGDRVLVAPVDAGTGPINSINGAMTVAIWVKTTQGTVYEYAINRDYIGGSNRDWNLFKDNFYGGGGRMFWSLYNTSGSNLFVRLTGSTDPQGNPLITMNDGKWHHIVGVYDGIDTAELYTDGVLQGSATSSGFGTLRTNARTVIGGFNNSGNPFAGGGSWNGGLSNAQIWDTNLSSTQIETLYNNGTPLTTAIASDNLKGWWKLDNTATFSTNWSVPDASGNGNTGTSSGMTEQNLVNNNVSVLNGESSGMTSASLVLSDLTRAVPYGDGYSFSFDAASSDYITASVSELNSASICTISFWGKKTASNKQLAVGGFIDASNGIWIQWYSDGNIYFSPRGPGAGSFSVSYAQSYDADWHHYVGVYDGTSASNCKLYLDGNLVATGSGTPPSNLPATTGDVFQIGALGTSFFTDGSISSVSVFNEKLTSTEVMKLYSNGVPQDLASFTPQPVAFYPLGSNSFWNGSQWTVRDMIGSNDGTGQNIGVDGLVGDAPRSEANGTGTNMDIPTNLEGSTKWSSNNSWSINMSSTARVEDTP